MPNPLTLTPQELFRRNRAVLDFVDLATEWNILDRSIQDANARTASAIENWKSSSVPANRPSEVHIRNEFDLVNNRLKEFDLKRGDLEQNLKAIIERLKNLQGEIDQRAEVERRKASLNVLKWFFRRPAPAVALPVEQIKGLHENLESRRSVLFALRNEMVQYGASRNVILDKDVIGVDLTRAMRVRPPVRPDSRLTFVSNDFSSPPASPVSDQGEGSESLIAFGSPPTRDWRDSLAAKTEQSASRPQSYSGWQWRLPSEGIEVPWSFESALASRGVSIESPLVAVRQRLSSVSSSGLRGINDSVSESDRRNITSAEISQEMVDILHKFWRLNPGTGPGESIADPLQDTYLKLTGGMEKMADAGSRKVGEATERPSSLSEFGSQEGNPAAEESNSRLSQRSELTIGVESVGGRTEPTSPALSAFRDRKPVEALPEDERNPAQQTLKQYSEQERKAEDTGRKIR
jgi:hypothetical protein